ncbi:MAG: DUF2442 domain-containing protein [Candidatus Omnitrophota bacterium]|jgi:hypothetical protein|nr:MAG: DUF2442 domain-containing protein [Candidatus Omnitrophota bacterium]
MFLHVTEAKYMQDYQVWIAFNDGTEGIIDLSEDLNGRIFEPLKDVDYFKSFHIEGHTLSWENGADFAPEFLRDLMSQNILCENKKG